LFIRTAFFFAAQHFPFPGSGYILKEGTGYRFVPAAWSHIL
jgi:hypothetical protein